MIITEDLVKEYDGKAVVNQLSVHVHEGEIYGFLGPNGAGKSTSIYMILGLLPPTRGSVRLFGKRLGDDYFAIKRNIGVVAEFQYVYGEMTAHQYVSFYADLYHVPNKKHRIDSLLDRVELGRYRHLPLRAFSKGMQQKLAMVRALVHDPALLILDEPVSSLDPHGIKQIRDMIVEENANGKTFVISSHLLSEIEKTCDRVGILHNGHLLVEDSMQGVIGSMAEGMELEIELNRTPETVIPQLTALPCVTRVHPQGGNALLVHTQGAVDHRETISKFLTDKGLVILTFKQNQRSLEEAFITLTETNIAQFAEGGVA